MTEIIKTVNGQLVSTISPDNVQQIDGQVITVLGVPAKIIVPVVADPTADFGFSHIMGVATGDMGTVIGVGSSQISKVIGV